MPLIEEPSQKTAERRDSSHWSGAGHFNEKSSLGTTDQLAHLIQEGKINLAAVPLEDLIPIATAKAPRGEVSHRDKVAAKGLSDDWFALVHKPVPIDQAL